MSKGIPTLWDPALMGRAIRRVFKQRCYLYLDNVPHKRGVCPCSTCKRLRLVVFGNAQPLPVDRRGFKWRTIRLEGMAPLPRTESQEYIAAHFDREEVRTHPDYW